jgi:hypothetical protein
MTVKADPQALAERLDFPGLNDLVRERIAKTIAKTCDRLEVSNHGNAPPHTTGEGARCIRCSDPAWKHWLRSAVQIALGLKPQETATQMPSGDEPGRILSAPEERPDLIALVKEVEARLEDIRFAPALGGQECDEVRTVYGQFFVKRGKALLSALRAKPATADLVAPDAILDALFSEHPKDSPNEVIQTILRYRRDAAAWDAQRRRAVPSPPSAGGGTCATCAKWTRFGLPHEKFAYGACYEPNLIDYNRNGVNTDESFGCNLYKEKPCAQPRLC